MEDEVRFEDDAPDALRCIPRLGRSVNSSNTWPTAILPSAHRSVIASLRGNWRKSPMPRCRLPSSSSTTSWVTWGGWLASVEDDQRFCKSFPLPRGQFLGRMWIIFLWAVSACTLTMAGFVGTKASRPTDGVISSSGFADAFLLTALPVLGLVALASIVQVGVARSRGVRVGNRSCTGPFDPALGDRRSSCGMACVALWHLCAPDAAAHGHARSRSDLRFAWLDGAQCPAVLILGGLCLWMVGWVMTPAASSVSALPISHDPGWFLGMLDGLLRTDLATRAACHPLVWAGATVTFRPGFPCCTCPPSRAGGSRCTAWHE